MILYGDPTFGLSVDCVAKTWGDVDCVGSVTFGDYLCRQDPSIPGTGINITYSSAQRYGTSLYTIGCTLPAPDASNTQVRSAGPFARLFRSLGGIHFCIGGCGGEQRADGGYCNLTLRKAIHNGLAP
jgi:hypothetical protein